MNMKRMDITLFPSDVMEKNKEHTEIRLPKKIRTKANPKRSTISVLGKKLSVKQAFSEDIKRAKEAKNSNKVPLVGFVSRSTFMHLCKEDAKERDAWISEASEPLMLGCDPEFVLVHKDRGYEYSNNILDHYGKLGNDGPCAEIRPEQDLDVDNIVNKIRDIIFSAPDKLDDYKFIGGSCFESPGRIVSIGGHISLGRIEKIKDETTTNVFNAICRILNATVAVPLYRIERPTPWLRRLDNYNNYGRYTDFRDHGDVRMEWRVPGGFWLVHPELASAILGTTKATVEAIYNIYAENGYDQTVLIGNGHEPEIGLNEMIVGLKEAKEYAKTILDSTDKVIPRTKDVKESLLILDEICTAGQTYEDYKGYVEFFKKLSTSRVDCSLDLRENWLEGGKLTTR